MKYTADFKAMPARFVPAPMAAPGFVPGTKAKLLETIAAMKPEYIPDEMNKLRGMSKRRLYAIYFQIRHRLGR